jgi:dienelactone hydrolase
MTSDLGRRTDVRIPAGRGEEIDAWMYLPDGPGPHPVVVMAHGIGGVKAAGLAPFAERFAAGGFAATVFDYRHWGRSSGQPRQLLSIRRQWTTTERCWHGRARRKLSMTLAYLFGGHRFPACISSSWPRVSQGWQAPSRSARWWTGLPEWRRSRCPADFG